MKKHVTTVVLGMLFSTLTAPFAAHAQEKVVQVQTPKDAWQVRRAQTHAMIRTINDPNVSQAQRDSAMHDFDARLAAGEKGELTPIEVMELFRVLYVPKELQNKSPNLDPVLRVIAMEATLGWYDTLRFADASGRSEIEYNEGFFTLAFGDNTRAVVEYIKAHPEQAAAAVKTGIQAAHDKIKANGIGYDAHWPASYGMLRMQCALRNAKSCETPKPQPENTWPALLDEADQQVSTFYLSSKSK